MKWYEVKGFQAHAGTRKETERLIYIKALNIIHAFDIYKEIPSIKKNWNGWGRFPNIRELDLEDSLTVEGLIIEDKRIINKECRFYFPHGFRMIY